jgi:hypothetical protein
MKTTSQIVIVSFVNKFIPTTARMKMMINGLAAIHAIDGYAYINLESYRMRKKI